MVLQSGGEASRRGGQHLRDSTPVGCLCKEQQYNDIRIVYRKSPKVPDWVWEITIVILGVILGVTGFFIKKDVVNGLICTEKPLTGSKTSP